MWSYHKEPLEDMFKALAKAVLTLRPSMARFGPHRVSYLRYDISHKGISIEKDGFRAVTDIKQPTAIRELREFLSAVKLLGRFISNNAEIVSPLTELTPKEFPRSKSLTELWTQKHNQLFTNIIRLLTSSPTLIPSQMTRTRSWFTLMLVTLVLGRSSHNTSPTNQ